MQNMFKHTDNEKLEKVRLTRARKGLHVSATKGGGKILQEAANNEEEAIIDPLQHDVFGSEVGGTKTAIMKEHRESLRELFQKTSTTEEKAEPVRSIRIEKKTDQNSSPLLKKRPEERTIYHSSKRSILTSAGNLDMALELHKILHLLHRVHTEATAISQKSQNLWKDIVNTNCTKEEEHGNINRMQSEDNILFPDHRDIMKMSLNHTKSKVSHPRYNAGTDTICRKECWIRSDAEYLILEL